MNHLPNGHIGGGGGGGGGVVWGDMGPGKVLLWAVVVEGAVEAESVQLAMELHVKIHLA